MPQQRRQHVHLPAQLRHVGAQIAAGERDGDGRDAGLRFLLEVFSRLAHFLREFLKLGTTGLAVAGIATAAVALTAEKAAAQAAGASTLRTVLDRGKLIVGTGSTNAPWLKVSSSGMRCSQAALATKYSALASAASARVRSALFASAFGWGFCGSGFFAAG